MLNKSAVKPANLSGEAASLDFIVNNMINRLYTALPVRVVKVYPPHFMDVMPLVTGLGNNGEEIAPVVIYGVVYMRLQGGNCAVEIEPQAGDRGICVFAMRDISGVKMTAGTSAPSSFRSYDPSDGMYVGGILNSAAVNFVKINKDLIEINSSGSVAVSSASVKINADIVEISGKLKVDNGIDVGGDITLQGDITLGGDISAQGMCIAQDFETASKTTLLKHTHYPDAGPVKT